MRILSNSHINNGSVFSRVTENNRVNFSAQNFAGWKDSETLNPYYSNTFNFLPKNEKFPDFNSLISDLQKVLFKKDLYSDIDSFSRYFEKKIQKMMKEPSESAIVKDVFEISAVNKTDEFDVCAVMSELTSFSSWNSLDKLETALKKAGCGKPYDIFHGDKNASIDFSLCENEGYLSVNDVLNYITDNKCLISLDESAPPCLYIDDFQLDEIERVKETMPKLFDKLSGQISDGSVKLAIINGWNAKACGKDVSQTFLGSAENLKSATFSVIKDMNESGKSLNDVLNGDSVKRIKNIFGDDVPYVIISDPGYRNYSPAGIKNNLSSRYPRANQIKAVIETVSQNSLYSDNSQSKIKRLLAKYFDVMTVCFSEKTISEEMKNKHAEILKILKQQGKSEDDALYIIPRKGKSFELMTYQYAKVNGINPSRICYYNGLKPVMKRFGEKLPDLNNKTLVVLDDIIGTGVTMIGGSFKYGSFSKSELKNSNVIFSSLAALPFGVDRIAEMRHLQKRPQDVILPGKITDYKKFVNLSGISDIGFFERAAGGSGYNSGWASVAFPYMLPDNNSNVAGLLFSFCLNSNNSHSNKSNELYKRYIDEVNKKAEEYSKDEINADLK